MYDVLEIGFLTQDLDIGRWADSSVIVPFLEQAARVEGIARFLFHQVHLHNHEGARASFAMFEREAKARGFAFWTAEEINAWERSRRQARLQTSGVGLDLEVSLMAQGDAEDVSPSEGKSERNSSGYGDMGSAARRSCRSGRGVKFGVPCLRKVIWEGI